MADEEVWDPARLAPLTCDGATDREAPDRLLQQLAGALNGGSLLHDEELARPASPDLARAREVWVVLCHLETLRTARPQLAELIDRWQRLILGLIVGLGREVFWAPVLELVGRPAAVGPLGGLLLRLNGILPPDAEPAIVIAQYHLRDQNDPYQARQWGQQASHRATRQTRRRRVSDRLRQLSDDIRQHGT